MKTKIYLAGQISRHYPETYGWRVKFTKLCTDEFDIEVIDPCASSANYQLLHYKNIPDLQDTAGVEVIVPKDKSYVLKSDIIIANMNQYDKDKPLIGTLFELAWAQDHPEKTVIGVFEDDITKDVYCNHPFIRNAVHCWVSNYTEAWQLVKKYFI